MNANSLKSMHHRFSRFREYRKTLAELRSMDSHKLDDIGLGSANFADVARRATYGA